MIREGDTQVVPDLFKDINQGRRGFYSERNRKAQPMGLTCTMVWILADNYHLNIMEGGTVEGMKNEFSGRVDTVLGLFLHEKTFQILEVGFRELFQEGFFPAFVNLGGWLFHGGFFIVTKI
jgi:hypothetical protein